MYKLLIVDDDPWVREWLVKHIDWKEHGFSVVSEAVNGLHALKIIDEMHPDIVITDIKMDGMDGLELAARIREKFIDIRVILLSGYNEFEYARFALKNGVVDYLLKPIDENELIALNIRLLKEIEQERSIRQRDQEIAVQLERSIPILQEKFIKELLSGNVLETDYLKNELSCRRFHMDFSIYYILLIEIDRHSNSGNIPDHEFVRSLRKELKDTAESLLNRQGTCISCFENERLVVAFNPKSNGFPYQVHEIGREFENKTGSTISLGVSSLKKEIAVAREAYTEAFEALKRKFYLGTNQVIFAGDIEPLSKEYNFEARVREQLLNAVNVGDCDKVRTLISEIFSEICKRRTALDLLQLILVRLVGILNDLLLRSGANHESALSHELDRCARLEEFETVQDLQEWVTDVFLKGIEAIYGNGSKRSRKIIEDTIEYIYQNIREDISLDIVAKVLFINPAYLSRLFKSEVGETFTHFLMKARIEKAKKLLKESYLKVYEISEQVGYKNEKYFSRIFKDFEGITPNEYRDRLKYL